MHLLERSPCSLLCFQGFWAERGPDPGLSATDASRLQSTETRATNTLGFNLSANCPRRAASRRQVAGGSQETAVGSVCHPPLKRRREAGPGILAGLGSQPPRPGCAALCPSLVIEAGAEGPRHAGSAQPRKRLPGNDFGGLFRLVPSPVHLQRRSEPQLGTHRSQRA